MKLNKKLIAPVLSLTALLAMGVGTTYALFTSSAETDIAIQAGKVKYAQEVAEFKTYSGVDLVGDPLTDTIELTAEQGKFTNGGSASYSDGIITLEKMTPGDKVTFELKVKNSSNVTTKVRTIREVLTDDGLFDGLKVTIDSEKWDGTEELSSWEVQAGVESETLVKTIAISVELPSDAGNEYQEKSCSMRFTVDAVQGNAAVVNPISVYNGDELVADYSNLHKAIEACKNKAYTVKLNQDIKLRKWQAVNCWNGVYNGFVLDGQGHSIKNLVVEGENEAAMFVSVASSLTIKDVVFDGADVTTTALKYAYAGVAVSKTYVNMTFEDVAVKNSEIHNTWQCGGLVGFGEQVDVSFKNCAVEDCFFGGKNATAGTLFGLGYVDVDVKDSAATNVTLYTDSLEWASTAKAAGNFAVGHLYDNALTTDNYEETNVTVYVADGLKINKAGEYEVSNGNGLAKIGEMVDGGNKLLGKTVKLVADIDLANMAWSPIGEVGYTNVFCGTLDGQSHKISNLTVTDQKSAGLFGGLGSSAVVKDFTIDKATVNSNHYAGAVAGWAEGGSVQILIDNVKVTNSSITTAAELIGAAYDNGDKAGGVIGYACYTTVQNCSVEDSIIQGYRDIGGLVGRATTGAVVSSNSVEDVQIKNDRSHNYQGYTEESQYNVGKIIGGNTGATASDNSFSNVTISVL